MGTKLNVDTGSDIGKKLWERHQADEYTHVDNYKEAICINCFKRDATSATIADICGDCGGKRGREPLLATVSQKMYTAPWMLFVIKLDGEQFVDFVWQSVLVDLIVAYPVTKLILKLKPRIEKITSLHH
jgi:hypothetical protein